MWSIKAQTRSRETTTHANYWNNLLDCWTTLISVHNQWISMFYGRLLRIFVLRIIMKTGKPCARCAVWAVTVVVDLRQMKLMLVFIVIFAEALGVCARTRTAQLDWNETKRDICVLCTHTYIFEQVQTDIASIYGFARWAYFTSGCVAKNTNNIEKELKKNFMWSSKYRKRCLAVYLRYT